MSELTEVGRIALNDSGWKKPCGYVAGPIIVMAKERLKCKSGLCHLTTEVPDIQEKRKEKKRNLSVYVYSTNTLPCLLLPGMV